MSISIIDIDIYIKYVNIVIDWSCRCGHARGDARSPRALRCPWGAVLLQQSGDKYLWNSSEDSHQNSDLLLTPRETPVSWRSSRPPMERLRMSLGLTEVPITCHVSRVSRVTCHNQQSSAGITVTSWSRWYLQTQLWCRLNFAFLVRLHLSGAAIWANHGH